MSDANTITSKTGSGPHAGRVGYSCRTCHTETQRRARSRTEQARHAWQAALTVPLRAGVAEHYARRARADAARPVRLRQHHTGLVVDVLCARCLQSWPGVGPCRRR